MIILEIKVIIMALTVFAERMKQARTQAGIKQNELAKTVHVTPTTISAYEKADTDGNGKKPTLENAQKIASALGVSLDWMCGNDQASPKSITEFSLQDFLKSIAIVLYEMSGTIDYYQNTQRASICIENEKIAYFCKQVNDLLVVYRNGVLTDEMYIDCVEKLIAGFKGYCFEYGNVLSYDEACEAESSVLNLFENCDDVAAGIFTTKIGHYANYEREVKLLITQKEYEGLTTPQKEGAENG